MDFRIADTFTDSLARLTGALLDCLTHRVHILEGNWQSYRLQDAKGAAEAEVQSNEPLTAGGCELEARSSPSCSFYLAANFSDDLDGQKPFPSQLKVSHFSSVIRRTFRPACTSGSRRASRRLVRTGRASS